MTFTIVINWDFPSTSLSLHWPYHRTSPSLRDLEDNGILQNLEQRKEESDWFSTWPESRKFKSTPSILSSPPQTIYWYSCSFQIFGIVSGPYVARIVVFARLPIPNSKQVRKRGLTPETFEERCFSLVLNSLRLKLTLGMDPTAQTIKAAAEIWDGKPKTNLLSWFLILRYQNSVEQTVGLWDERRKTQTSYPCALSDENCWSKSWYWKTNLCEWSSRRKKTSKYKTLC